MYGIKSKISISKIKNSKIIKKNRKDIGKWPKIKGKNPHSKVIILLVLLT